MKMKKILVVKEAKIIINVVVDMVVAKEMEERVILIYQTMTYS